MKKHRIWSLLACGACALLLCVALVWSPGEKAPVATDNAGNFGTLLTDLVNAYEKPTAMDAGIIEADLEAIRAVDQKDYEIARAIADHWRSVYLDPDYRLFLHHGEETAPELADTGIPNSRSHAIVVLGYELLDGEMQTELKERCNAAAAAARTFPETILVCSGGATGANNREGHTEAGLMKAYLSEQCGIDSSRIYIDEKAMTTAENAVNTLAILQKNGVSSMTIVTSAYHQRWGQTLYNLLAELYRQQHAFSVEIVGNYCCEVEPSSPVFTLDDRIAVRQLAGILGLPDHVVQSLPPLRLPASASSESK